MGGASRQTVAATLPPDRFYCLLDELPLHLIPRHSLEERDSRNRRHETLFVNPECFVCAAGQLPDELLLKSERLAGFAGQAFALQTAVAWVRDAATGNLLPFWLGPELESMLRGLRRDEPVPSSVPERVCCLLEAAHILLPECRARREQAGTEVPGKAARQFREKDYAPVSGLIHPFHIAALRRYYRHLIRTGAVRLGDSQSMRRYVAYNEPVARFFHHQITSIVSTVAGEPLKPSYVYFASYLSGAELKRHSDREQCEFSVTFCLDFSPEPKLETPWPIRLDTPTDTVTVYQALGDGLAYRGTRLPHYRDVLGAGQTSTSIFFHYVSEDFSGPLD